MNKKFISFIVIGSFVISRNFQDWQYILCEYMMTHQTPYARRQVEIDLDCVQSEEN